MWFNTDVSSVQDPISVTRSTVNRGSNTSGTIRVTSSTNRDIWTSFIITVSTITSSWGYSVRVSETFTTSNSSSDTNFTFIRTF